MQSCQGCLHSTGPDLKSLLCQEALSLLPDDSKVAEALLPTHYHGEGGGWAAALPELLNMLPHMKVSNASFSQTAYFENMLDVSLA